MKPTSPRAARRLSQKARKDSGLTLSDLAQRVARAKVKGVDAARLDRARRILTSYLQTAQAHGLTAADVAQDMASGQAAWRLGHAVRDEIMKAPPDAVRKAACAEGCAFCCILSEGDGGLITAFEAQQLHAGLGAVKGETDGRDWHPAACPALDPDTRTCRAYEARPMICRSFISTDAGACERNASGAAEQGAGLLGSHLDYLIVLGLCRAALKGITLVQTYSMAGVAAGAVAGEGTTSSLQKARHGVSTLDKTCADAVAAAG